MCRGAKQEVKTVHFVVKKRQKIYWLYPVTLKSSSILKQKYIMLKGLHMSLVVIILSIS